MPEFMLMDMPIYIYKTKLFYILKIPFIILRVQCIVLTMDIRHALTINFTPNYSSVQKTKTKTSMNL